MIRFPRLKPYKLHFGSQQIFDSNHHLRMLNTLDNYRCSVATRTLLQ